MNCSVAQQLLQLYLDHELEPVEARALEDHVAQCAECRGQFLHLERSLLTLESLPRARVPSRVYNHTMAQLRQERTSSFLNKFQRPLTNGAITLVALLGLLFALPSSADLSSVLFTLDADGLDGMVDSAMVLAVSADLSFIAGIGMLFAACSIGLLQLVVRHQSIS